MQLTSSRNSLEVQKLNLRSKQSKNPTDLIVATLWGRRRRRCRIRVLLISRICHTPPPCAIHLLLPRVNPIGSRCFYCHTQHPIPGLRGILLRPNPRSPKCGRIPQRLRVAAAERRRRHRHVHPPPIPQLWAPQLPARRMCPQTKLAKMCDNSISRCEWMHRGDYTWKPTNVHTLAIKCFFTIHCRLWAVT